METPTGNTLSIAREALLQLPIWSYDGPVHLVNRPADVSPAVDALRREELLGFDIETKPSFTRGVVHPPALLQLSGPRDVFVFQLSKLNRLDQLKDLLASPKTLKVGTAIRDDIKKLKEFDPFDPNGFIEIGELCRSKGIKQTGLRPLAGLLLGVRLSKREQRSNWARANLTPFQVTYAATDAWIGRKIYLELLGLPDAPPPPPEPAPRRAPVDPNPPAPKP